MTPFTSSLIIEEIVLRIDNPYIDNNNDSVILYDQIINIGKPFEQKLWFTLLASVLLVSLMHNCFTSKIEVQNVWQNKFC